MASIQQPILRRPVGVNRVTKPSLEGVKHIPSSSKAVRTWSLEEERILLQLRSERMPYKKIGHRLGKSDLACRLHFHQMHMAKRSPESLPGRSLVYLVADNPPEYHRLLPTSHRQPAFTTCRPSSPELASRSRNGPRGRIRSPYKTRAVQIEDSNNTKRGSQSALDEVFSRSVDLDQLYNLYKECSQNLYQNLWTTIANKYTGSGSVSPSMLEQLFCISQSDSEHGSCDEIGYGRPIDVNFMLRSPSPDSVTVVDHNRQVSVAERCSVESLLNHTA